MHVSLASHGEIGRADLDADASGDYPSARHWEKFHDVSPIRWPIDLRSDMLAGMPDDRSAKQREAEMRVGWKMGGLGLEITAHVVAGALLGWGYDQWRGTAPRGITIGAIAGIVTGMVALVRGALRLNRELERTAPTKGRGEPIPYPDDDDEDGNNDKKHDRWDRENQNDWQRH